QITMCSLPPNTRERAYSNRNEGRSKTVTKETSCFPPLERTFPWSRYEEQCAYTSAIRVRISREFRDDCEYPIEANQPIAKQHLKRLLKFLIGKPPELKRQRKYWRSLILIGRTRWNKFLRHGLFSKTRKTCASPKSHRVINSVDSR